MSAPTDASNQTPMPLVHAATIARPARATRPGVTRILVVDDEYVNRAVLAKLVSKDGHEVESVEDGARALDALATSAFDMVLLDIRMPQQDGFDVLRRIRQQYSEAELPVIMVTAHDDSATVVKALDMGANDYITKPLDLPVARARIRMQLRFRESQLALKKSEERYALVAKGTNDGLWDWDLDTNKVFYSPRWQTLVAINGELCDSPEDWLTRIHPEDRLRVENEIANHLAGLSPLFETEMRMRHSEETYRWMLCRGLAVFDDQNIPHRMAGSLTDITEGKVADALTGLPNRVLFRERLNRCFQKHRRNLGWSFGLFYLDLDNFKQINDCLGHDTGDRLLVAVARRLESALREADSFVCRLGGDEFSIIIEDIKHQKNAIGVAERVISSVSAPISLGSGREVFPSVSVGIVTSLDECQDPESFLQAADTAMYHAKEQGKSCYRVFDPDMRADVTRKLDIESELRLALQRQSLHLDYQPIVDLQTQEITGVEALIRWHHPTLGNISPADFIPIAEESGVIIELGKQVLSMACSCVKKWIAERPELSGLQLYVNTASRQLSDPELCNDIRKVLKQTGLPASNLTLEVTEATIQNNPSSVDVLELFNEMGLKVAIDDFGTGYSSLSYIHSLSPDAIKIDRSFVDQLATSNDKQTVVSAFIKVVDSLNLDVVAEGVETEAQSDLLRSMGCRFAQGYHYSKPLDETSMAGLLGKPLSPQS